MCKCLKMREEEHGVEEAGANAEVSLQRWWALHWGGVAPSPLGR